MVEQKPCNLFGEIPLSEDSSEMGKSLDPVIVEVVFK
jgi:hypothetical protein